MVTGRTIEEIAAGQGAQARLAFEPERQGQREGRRDTNGGKASARERRKSAPQPAHGSSAQRRRRPKSKAEKTSRGRPLPDFVPPSLATLRDNAPSGEGWVHEIKFDGYRMQARLDRRQSQAAHPQGARLDRHFKHRGRGRKACRRHRADRRRDRGRERRGVRDFSMLQDALKTGERERFRLLRVRSAASRRRGPVQRAADRAQGRAEGAAGEADGTGAVRYSEHFEEDGAVVLAARLRHASRRHRLEAARCALSLRPLRHFIKTKCCERAGVRGRRLLAVDRACRRAIGALVLGYYRRRQAASMPAASAPATRRRWRATCGSSCIRWRSRQAAVRQDPAQRSAPPRRASGSSRRWWSKSTFRGWTGDRHGAPGGVQGRARGQAREGSRAGDAGRTSRAAAQPRSRRRRQRLWPRNRNAPPTAKRAAKARKTRRRSQARADGEVRFTNPDRVYWADVGVTKQELADYYRSVWDWIAPHVVNRPLALVRCPDGTSGRMLLPEARLRGPDRRSICAA